MKKGLLYFLFLPVLCLCLYFLYSALGSGKENAKTIGMIEKDYELMLNESVPTVKTFSTSSKVISEAMSKIRERYELLESLKKESNVKLKEELKNKINKLTEEIEKLKTEGIVERKGENIKRGIAIAIVFGILIWLWLLFPFLTITDARKRMKTSAAIIWTIVVVFTTIFGYVLYLLVRPDLPKKCAKCGQKIVENYKYCPYCGAETVKFCKKCGREVNVDWKICGYCGNEIKKEE